jgi:hypothetical protein
MSDELLGKASAIRLINEGQFREGPWRFMAQGTIGAYPRWVHESGLIVFHQHVAEAKP